MGIRDQYRNAKAALLADAGVCDANRALFGEFFAFEEYKLKRQNGLPDLDDGCCRTLYTYIIRLRAVNRWFGNMPWRNLTKQDIKRVYDALEDGTIHTAKGIPVQDRQSYYNKIFKSKPFRLAGKADLAREVIEYSTAPKRVVRFLNEDGLRSIVDVVSNPIHLFLLWLAWDIGENIGTLLQLARRDFIVQVSRSTQQREYLINLPIEKLKRSRLSRSEITHYPETVRYADIVLAELNPNDPVFRFGARQADKMLKAAVKRSGAVTMPFSETVRWKDFRSGMACHLLRNGLTRDEVNARLGHTPHSAALDAYINFLALDRDKPKQKLVEGATAALRLELEESRRTAQLLEMRHRESDERWRTELLRTRTDLDALREQVARMAPGPVSG